MEASAVPRLAPTGVAALASPALLRLLSDDRLVALIREGNTNAFEALYDRHHRAILSFCRHMLGGADEAEDAVQHTFLAAYNDLVSSRKQIQMRAWLFTIARNRCLTILRARPARIALEFEEKATDGLAAQVQRREDLRDLVVDINHLPDDQRAALVLAEIGALSHDEIGSVIGVPKGKVKALVFQARESLLASRAAREADCDEIRAQLATMHGGALRRTTLRRHLRECQGCRDYRDEIGRQRQRIAAILPVVPTIALREAILGVTASGGAAGAGLAGGGAFGAGSVLKGLAGKALVAAVLAAVGTTGTILAVHDFRLQAAPRLAKRFAGTRSVTHTRSPRARSTTPASAAAVLTSAGASRLGSGTSTRTGTPGARMGSSQGQRHRRASAPARVHVPAAGPATVQTAPVGTVAPVGPASPPTISAAAPPAPAPVAVLRPAPSAPPTPGPAGKGDPGASGISATGREPGPSSGSGSAGTGGSPTSASGKGSGDPANGCDPGATGGGSGATTGTGDVRQPLTDAAPSAGRECGTGSGSGSGSGTTSGTAAHTGTPPTTGSSTGATSTTGSSAGSATSTAAGATTTSSTGTTGRAAPAPAVPTSPTPSSSSTATLTDRGGTGRRPTRQSGSPAARGPVSP
jgi:RNA polymerase sigma factor (sigma-70 family)